MLDAMRRGVANLLAKILLGLLIVAFAVWGIGDYVVRRPAQSALATVGKTQITVDEFRQAYQDEMQAARASSAAPSLPTRPRFSASRRAPLRA